MKLILVAAVMMQVQSVNGPTTTLVNPQTKAVVTIKTPATKLLPGQMVSTDGTTVQIPKSPNQLLREKNGR